MAKGISSTSKRPSGISYSQYKSSRSTMKAKKRSYMPISYLPPINESNVNMRRKTKRLRRGERPETYLMEVRALLKLLIKGRDKFNEDKFERHSLIADAVLGSVTDTLRAIGREIDEEDGFEFVEELIKIINEIIGEYKTSGGEDKENLGNEMYLLAKSIKEAIMKGNKIYKDMKTVAVNNNMENKSNSSKSKHVESVVANKNKSDDLGSLLMSFSAMKVAR